MSGINKLAGAALISGGIVVLLVYARGILLPLVLAVFLWLIIRSIRNYLQQWPWVDKYVPVWLLNVLATVIIFVLVGLVGSLLVQNVSSLSEVLPKYQENIDQMVSSLNGYFNISVLGELNQLMQRIDLNSYVSSILGVFSGFMATLGMVLIYVLFLLIEEDALAEKVTKVFSSENQKKISEKVFKSMTESIEKYLLIKTWISILSGLLSYFVMIAYGVDFAFFWAFLVFVTSYIPNIGAIIGMVFPALFALFQYNSWEVFVWLMIWFGIIQFVTANIMEPRWMGRSMNLSTLVVVLSLAVWASIWGIMGAILSVPLTMIVSIILAQFEGTKKVAILLSERGNLPN